MQRNRIAVALAAGMLLGFTGMSGTATAAQPTIERIAVDDSFTDEDLCEFDVSVRVVGRLIVRTFDGIGTGAAEVRTVNQVVTFSAGDNAVRFRDVGADIVRIEPDGTAVLSLIGQLPFWFNGVLKIDLETDEIIQEPKFKVGAVEELCAALGA